MRKIDFTLVVEGKEILHSDTCVISTLEELVECIEQEKLPALLIDFAARFFRKVKRDRRDQSVFTPLIDVASKILSVAGTEAQSWAGKALPALMGKLLSDDFNYTEDQKQALALCAKALNDYNCTMIADGAVLIVRS